MHVAGPRNIGNEPDGDDLLELPVLSSCHAQQPTALMQRKRACPRRSENFVFITQNIQSLNLVSRHVIDA